MKKILIFHILLLFLSCASDPEQARSNKYLNEENNESSEKILEKNIDNVIDFYPIPDTKIQLTKQAYELPLPNQFFSAENKNEIRLHSLGEIRWIYLGIEPSKVWPIIEEFIQNDDSLNVGTIDPNQGVIETQSFEYLGATSKFQYKLERGLQRESSELFISQLVKEKDNWVKVKLDTELIENHSRLLLDHFSNSGPVSGTSLVALNLNNEDKAIVYEDENDGETKIKVMISFPRAWAAVERSLKIAGLDLVDKNRDEGKFYLSWKGSPSFFNRSENNRVIQVRIEKIEEDISIISIFMENKDLEVSKEIISQINQALT